VKINKILIYGSAHLTEETCNLLKNHYDLVGYIPSVNPVIAGNIDLPIVDENIQHDIKLSLQYNKRITNIENAYNVHTGLLPSWGGVDILYHTIKDRKESYIFEQGLTFHKMSDDFDYGPIISKVTYPVYEDDTMVDLYDRITKCFPSFVLSGLKLLESLDEHQVNNSYKEKPRVFKRGNIDDMDSKLYEDTLKKLKRKYEKI
jgi:methionyl-tRNA formyltransferase